MNLAKTSLSFLFFGLALLGLSACRTSSHSPSLKSPGFLEESAGVKPPDNAILSDPLSRGLANGWDSELERKLSPCLEGEFVYRGAQSSDLSFMRDFTYDQILKETGAGLYGKASLFGLASAKVQGDMALSLASTDDSTSFIYHFSLLGKSAVLSDRRFNPKGSIAYSGNDLTHFREQCGDQFVEQVKLGGQLYIGVKYTFASKETKEKISVGVTLSLFWGLIKVSKTWTKEFRDLMKDVRISIEAYQVGGDPKQLETLKSSILTGSCAGDEPELCAAAVDRLLEYGSKDFAAQLEDMRLSETPDRGPAIIGLVLDDYRSLPIFDPQSNKSVQVNVTVSTTPENDLKKAMSSIERLLVNLRIAEGRMKVLSEFDLSESDRLLVRASQQNIAETLKAIEVQMGSTCLLAQSNSNFLKPCLESLKAIELQGQKAVVPVNLSRSSP